MTDPDIQAAAEATGAVGVSEEGEGMGKPQKLLAIELYGLARKSDTVRYGVLSAALNIVAQETMDEGLYLVDKSKVGRWFMANAQEGVNMTLKDALKQRAKEERGT